MILVVGGMASGKRTFARGLGFPEEDMAFDVHGRLRDGADAGALLGELSEKAVITCAEVGNGIVPLDPGERAWREAVGRLSCALAERADAVVRMVCGIPVVLKGSLPGGGDLPEGAPAEGGLPTAARKMSMEDNSMIAAQATDPPRREPPRAGRRHMELVLIRHGQTPGNGERRYVGAVDQLLSDEGRAQARAAGAHGEVRRVYVSTLQRTHETAAIMFPNAEQVIVDDVQEMDFGVFAGRSPDEMTDDPAYRAWVDSECKDPCPGGESQAQFTDRVCAALETLLREVQARGEDQVVMVAHGGTMMAFLDRYGNDPSKKYWEWLRGNCEGYRITLTCDDAGIKVDTIEQWQ